MNERDVKGVFVPVVTPFLANGKLDEVSFHYYIGKILDQDIDGIIINGTTGESPTVSCDEVTTLVNITKEQMKVRKNLPILVGTGTNNTASTVKLTEMAGEIGADGSLVVVPYYSRPSQEGICAHFKKVAEVGLPIIAYEIPLRTGIGLSIESAKKILDTQNVIGMKDSTSDLYLVTELVKSGSKPILCGNDVLFQKMIEKGATGGILASANLFTNLFKEVYRNNLEGEQVISKRLFDHLLPLVRLLFQEPNPSPIKWVLAEQKIISTNTVRLPLTPISTNLMDELRQILNTIES